MFFSHKFLQNSSKPSRFLKNHTIRTGLRVHCFRSFNYSEYFFSLKYLFSHVLLKNMAAFVTCLLPSLTTCYSYNFHVSFFTFVPITKSSIFHQIYPNRHIMLQIPAATRGVSSSTYNVSSLYISQQNHRLKLLPNPTPIVQFLYHIVISIRIILQDKYS